MTQGDEEEDARGGDRLDFQEVLGAFFREPTLWPVAIAGVGIFATLGAALIIFALQDRNLYAMLALAIAVGMSGFALEGDLRRRRPGLASSVLLGLWSLSALGAFLVTYSFGA